MNRNSYFGDSNTPAVSKLPLDCWSVVIEFLRKEREVLSLFRVIEGLYEYVKRILPQCTKNIIYSLRQIPDREIHHVSNVRVINKIERRNVSLHEFLDRFHISSVTSLFNGILSKFPFLLKLELNFCQYKRDRLYLSKGSFESPTIVINRSNKHYSLNFLTITLFGANLEVSQDLPNLQYLHLERKSETIKRQDEANLDIDFSKLPKLRTLKLSGKWKTKSSIFETNNNLRNVCLRKGAIVPDSNIEKSENLQTLELIGVSSIRSFTSLQNSNLRKLVVDGSSEYWRVRFDQHKLPFSPTDSRFHNNLVELTINCDKTLVLETPLQIYGEHLQKVGLRNFNHYGVIYFDTPSLKCLDIIDCSHTIIISQKNENDAIDDSSTKIRINLCACFDMKVFGENSKSIN